MFVNPSSATAPDPPTKQPEQPLNPSSSTVLTLAHSPATDQSIPSQPTIETTQNPLQLDTNNTEVRVYRRRRTTEQPKEPLQTQHFQS